MNRLFVCVKVDREERPDLDGIYMDAVQTMTGQGGRPMTVFLTAATLLGQEEHPKVVQELLGHAQVSITLDRDSHMTPTPMSGAAATIDRLLDG